MLKISDSTKSQGALGLNQTLNKQAESTSINNIAITSPSNNISQLKSTDVNNIIDKNNIINKRQSKLPSRYLT